MNFDEINKRIAETAAQKQLEQVQKAIDTPQHGPVPTGMVGIVVSKPGTERVTLDATSFQLMECETSMSGSSKRRFCIVEKKTKANYGNQFINSAGERAHVITHDLYLLLSSVLNNASKQIADLRRDNLIATEQRDLYKGTIDTLRKNGIIE